MASFSRPSLAAARRAFSLASFFLRWYRRFSSVRRSTIRLVSCGWFLVPGRPADVGAGARWTYVTGGGRPCKGARPLPAPALVRGDVPPGPALVPLQPAPRDAGDVIARRKGR